MGNLQQVIYAPLHEEEVSDHTGWQKQTVDYVISNRSKICKSIRSMSRGNRKSALQQQDVEDIYQGLLMYLHGADDYDLDKAYEYANGNGFISLEGYVNACLKHCVQRACSELNTKERELISETIKDEDDKDLNIFNTIPDPNASFEDELISVDFRTLCKSYECLRYRFGPDLYLVLYTRLLCKDMKHDGIFSKILTNLGISKRDLGMLNEMMCEEHVMMEMTRAITSLDADEAIDILQGYVFSANRIKELVLTYTV